jgi:hypothetical protein
MTWPAPTATCWWTVPGSRLPPSDRENEARSFRQVLPLAAQDHGRGKAVGHDLERGRVVIVEPARPGHLDVEHPEQLAVGEERHADLAHDVVVRGDVLRLGGHVRHEDRLAGPGDLADDPAIQRELLDRRVVVALGAEPEDAAVPRVDRGELVAERIHQQPDDGVQGHGCRPIVGEDPTDRLDRNQLAGPPPLEHLGAAKPVA